MAAIIMQLAVFGLLLALSPQLYLWLKGLPLPKNLDEQLFLMMRLSLEDIDHLEVLKWCAMLGWLTLLGTTLEAFIQALK